MFIGSEQSKNLLHIERSRELPCGSRRSDRILGLSIHFEDFHQVDFDTNADEDIYMFQSGMKKPICPDRR